MTKKDTNNSLNEPSSAVTQTSVTSISIFIGICLGFLLFTIKSDSLSMGFNAVSLAIICLALAIILFILANEFFLLGIWYRKHLTYFGFVGSISYGHALILLILGISFFLNSLDLELFSYVFLTMYLVGKSVYYVIRIAKIGRESFRVQRTLVRLSLLTVLGVGYTLLYFLQK